MIYSRHTEDAGRDRRVSSMKEGLCMSAAEWACVSFSSKWSGYLVSRDGVVEEIQELRKYVNLVSKIVSVSYLYLRVLSPVFLSLGLSPGERN